ncbi:proteoglycan 4-like [Daphnia magna]|uniref:proteoglycan 4-like n=1 Tax=Daphnia magna TaxID=35525 RepID=UPI001E1BBACB|nr:proteoglycan 4-like [Daphnia magna]
MENAFFVLFLRDPSFELQPGKGQENITEVDSPISAAAEEISRDETNILVPELTNPDTEWAIPDAESLLLAEEASPEPETATSVSEDAHASAESAMELMSLHYVDDEEATSPAAEPIDLYEKETKHSTGEPIHTPEQPNYPIMQPTSLDEGTTLLTATAMATEKIAAAAETGIPITESTTPAANTIIATAETTAQAERTITPVETTNVAAETVIPVRETTSQIEVMTHSFAELATLKTERIPAVETATVEPTNPVTQETKIVEPTTLAAEATSIDAKTITTTVASFIEPTTRAPETIPAKETVMVAVEQMTPTSPDAKPMTLVSILANPSTEPELVSTNPIPGMGVTTVNAESLISSTERSVTESTVLAGETMTPAAISVVTKEIVPTMEMTAPVALITNSVAEKTNLTAEQISTGEQTSVVTMDPIRPATLEAELSRTSEKPAIPSVWPASSYPTETIWGGGSATPSLELAIPSTESVTPAKVPATSTADPATPTVGPTIPATEPGTVTSGPDTPTAKSVTPSIEPVPSAPASGPANPAADASTLAPEPPTPMAESTTSTADPATRVVGSTMLATESATSSANLAVLASEPATMAAEPATSTVQRTTWVPELATQTAELATLNCITSYSGYRDNYSGCRVS